MSPPSSSALRPSLPSDPFAVVASQGGIESVALPPAYAAAAVLEYLRLWQQEGQVVEAGQEAGSDRWRVSVRATDTYRRQPLFAGPWARGGDSFHYDFPRGLVIVPRGRSRWLRFALEKVKPAEVDERGLPLPWVPVVHAPKVHVAPGGGGQGQPGPDDEEDVFTVADGEPLETLPPVAASGAPCGVDDGTIAGLCERLRASVGYPAFDLVIERAEGEQHGFTAGRVWFGDLFVPRRILLVVCPNADLAEVAATLLHELAHPLSRSRGHGPAFKQTLLELAGSAYGARYFDAARAALGGRQALLDLWIATGVRASLRGDDPPAPRAVDDGTAARVVSRIRKLRALAADQPGTPEGVAATAAANDLSALYGFGDCEVRVEPGLDDQLVDRFLHVEKGKVWKRELAFAVSRFCNVFGLSSAREGRMHLFGRYADLVFAEHLYGVCEESIERKADEHVAAWKARRPARPTAAESRRERTSFCDTAVVGLRARMKELRLAEEGAGPTSTSGVHRHAQERQDPQSPAEELARAEYEKRGFHLGSGSRKEIDFNSAGYEAGQAIQLGRALGDDAEREPLALPHGRGRR